MSDQQTEAFWTQPRNVLPTWRERVEAAITRVRDAYDALWDIMPAIAAFAFLLWIINTFSR